MPVYANQQEFREEVSSSSSLLAGRRCWWRWMFAHHLLLLCFAIKHFFQSKYASAWLSWSPISSGQTVPSHLHMLIPAEQISVDNQTEKYTQKHELIRRPFQKSTNSHPFLFVHFFFFPQLKTYQSIDILPSSWLVEAVKISNPSEDCVS